MPLELQETCGVEVRILACQSGQLPEEVHEGLPEAVSNEVPRAADWLSNQYSVGSPCLGRQETLGDLY